MGTLKDFISAFPLSETELAKFCSDPISYLGDNDYPTDRLPKATSSLDPEHVSQITLVKELIALLQDHAVDPETEQSSPETARRDTWQGAPSFSAPPVHFPDASARPIESFAPAPQAEAARHRPAAGLAFPEFAEAFEKKEEQRGSTLLAESGSLSAQRADPDKPCTDALPDAFSAGNMEIRRIIGVPEAGGGDMTAEAIILADDRIQVNDSTATPFNWMCRLEITAANGSRWLGTGWYISPSVMVTAGHCVYLHNHGGWVQSISVFVGQNQMQVDRAFTSAHFATTQGWVHNRDTVQDYGVVFGPPGNQGYFGYGVLPDATLNGALANVTGYPQDKPSGTLWGHAKRLQPPLPTLLQYEIDTFGGMSGAPVVMWDGQDYVATGIHNYGGSQLNTASRLTETVFYNFERWKTLGMNT